MPASFRLVFACAVLLSPLARAEVGERQAANTAVGSSTKILRYCEHLLDELGVTDPRGLERARWNLLDGIEDAWDQDQDAFLSARELAAQIRAYARHRSLRALAASALTPTPTDTPQQGSVPSTTQDPSERASLSETANPLVNGDAVDQAAVPGAAVQRATAANQSERATRFHVGPARRAEGAAPWFNERDEDGDGQVTLAEFAPQATGRSVQEFRRYDLNRDGVITRRESRHDPAAETEGSADAKTEPAAGEPAARQSSPARRSVTKRAERPTRASSRSRSPRTNEHPRGERAAR